jgi:hypothetical protein
MSERCDLRREARRPCDTTITILWRDQRGEEKFSYAKALDISGRGLLLQMPVALPRQTYLTLNASKLGLLGHASVRHCARTRGAKFTVGVEFTAGLSWTPKD